jgi:hypothetical protein
LKKSSKDQSGLENNTTSHVHNNVKGKCIEAEVTAKMFGEDKRFRTRTIPSKGKHVFHKERNFRLNYE